MLVLALKNGRQVMVCHTDTQLQGCGVVRCAWTWLPYFAVLQIRSTFLWFCNTVHSTSILPLFLEIIKHLKNQIYDLSVQNLTNGFLVFLKQNNHLKHFHFYTKRNY